MPPVMKHCPDCKAPNPPARTACYVCGVPLDKPREVVPAPGVKTFPCLNCNAAMALSAPFCPGCGRGATASAAPVEPALTAFASAGMIAVPLPPHWIVESLPDGTTLLFRTTWGRLSTNNATWPSVFFVAASLLWNLLITRPVRGDEGAGTLFLWLAYGPIVLLVLSGIAAYIRVIFAREEIRCGAGLLILRRYLGKIEQTKRLDGERGTLRVESHKHNSYHAGDGYTTHTLLALVGAKKAEVDSRPISQHLRGLFFYDGKTSDEVESLARFLAAKTGWALENTNRAIK